MGEDYHRQIGFPDVEKPTGKFELEHTDHAVEESKNDRYGEFKLPTCVNITKSMYLRDPKKATGNDTGEKTIPHVFEITIEEGEVVEVLARTGYDEERDIVLIINPNQEVLITAWTNQKGDHHATLNKEQYAKP